MADVQTDFYPKPVDPLNKLSEAVGIRNAVTQNQLMQQEYQGQQGLANLYASPGAKNPDGSLNTNYLTQNASQAGILAPKVADQAQNFSIQSQILAREKLDTAAKMHTAIATGLPQILQDPTVMQNPDKLQKAVMGVAADAYHASGGQGDAPQVFLSRAMQAMQNPNGPEAGIKEELAQSQAVLGNIDAYKSLHYGTPNSLDLGQQIQPGVTPAEGGFTPQGSPINKQLPTGTKVYNPNSQQYEYIGAGGGSSPQNPSAPSTQAQPGGVPSASLAGAIDPSKAVMPSGGAAASPPLGSEEYASTTAGAAGDRYSQTIAEAKDAPLLIDAMKNVRALSKEGVSTGPGQDWQNHVLGVFANSPILSQIPGLKDAVAGAKDNVSKFQEIQKYLYQNSLRLGGALGNPTDSRTEAAAHASPSDANFPASLQELAAYNIGQYSALMGKANAQDKVLGPNGGTPQQQAAFENKWRNAYDPEIFRLQTADPEDHKAMIDALTPAQAKGLREKRSQLKEMGALQ